jgi:hypothetical protein
MRTAEYQARFGHWQYATDRGTKFVVKPPGSRDTLILDSGFAEITGTDGAAIPVASEVVAAGTMLMTAHVHDGFTAGKVLYMAHNYLRYRESDPEHGGYRQDPEAGEGAAERRAAKGQMDLIDLCDRHRDDIPAFDRAIDDERARLRVELRATLSRVRALLTSG